MAWCAVRAPQKWYCADVMRDDPHTPQLTKENAGGQQHMVLPSSCSRKSNAVSVMACCSCFRKSYPLNGTESKPSHPIQPTKPFGKSTYAALLFFGSH